MKFLTKSVKQYLRRAGLRVAGMFWAFDESGRCFVRVWVRTARQHRMAMSHAAGLFKRLRQALVAQGCKQKLDGVMVECA